MHLYSRYAILVLFIILVLLYIKDSSSYDSFEDLATPVPDVCKKAGYKFPDGLLKILSDDPKKDPKRLYTMTECNQLDGGVYQSDFCYQLKDNTKKDDRYNLNKDNILVNYSDLCVGLNKTNTPVIDDCKINGKNLGKPNKAFVVTTKDKDGKDKKWNYDDNFFQTYSKNECDQFKGNWISIESIMKDKKISEDEIKSYVATNGKDTGICLTFAFVPSVVCVPTATPTTSSKVSDALKDGIKEWLS